MSRRHFRHNSRSIEKARNLHGYELFLRFVID
nr:MAG TPA: hypothetical protein [Caudoviricetes sp.]